MALHTELPIHRTGVRLLALAVKVQEHEPMAPLPTYSPEKAAYAARRHLRDLLTSAERGEAINQVGRLLGRYVDGDAASDRPEQQSAEPVADEQAAYFRLWGYCAVLVGAGGAVWRTSRPTKRREVAEACVRDWGSTHSPVLVPEVRELYERAHGITATVTGPGGAG